MVIIDLVLAPTQRIINGPKATLGKELIIVKNGLNILKRVFLNQKIEEIKKPRNVPIIKHRIIS